MTRAPHVERHFTASNTVRDIIIGMADGLTVPFALAAGLSGAVADTGIVVIAGLAEIAAGAISMGLGGYLAAKSDADHYDSERAREQREIIEIPDEETAEVRGVLDSYGLSREESEPIVQSLRQHRDTWVDFMMRFELGLERPDPKRALISAATIGGSYAVGGLVPLSPYIVLPVIQEALLSSVIITGIALAVFGFAKGYFISNTPIRSAIQTTVVGGIAAAAAFALAKAIS